MNGIIGGIQGDIDGLWCSSRGGMKFILIFINRFHPCPNTKRITVVVGPFFKGRDDKRRILPVQIKECLRTIASGERHELKRLHETNLTVWSEIPRLTLQ